MPGARSHLAAVWLSPGFRFRVESRNHIKADLSSGDENLLNPRQKEIVKLIAEDLTSKEIGKHLRIAQKTVEHHRRALKERLGVKGTAGIVRYAIRHGIIEP